MKKIWSLLVVVVITIVGCSKKEEACPSVNVSAPATEVATLKAYLDANNISATADPRGFFYTITTPGSAARPTVCQTVQVAYVGKFTNGQTFDSSPSAVFSLSDLITGWQEGIPLIGTGGSITLYLPPSLAYGSGARDGIPANSNLIFTIDLKAFR
ncbi:FKBP-type peptidyl-prolyl cis-trans isomerase [Segetibacter sp.]|jgi:FKBP-type peptidyl-prolyl cis-trans isomerase FkpA|uniref:FKBP-type peptidyl-prolyl cis-trans isomerase n=1 Tax=Segetibacter sp. TaxID=2231182 RepID=UPI0026102632|nr:FKBP-type peptidyl-prolyl cis-trans isomerase [Segetibacter sp.]MCW3082568.1 FKBP-type peptidylprolyl isomerase [Segetibacter sp.]